MISPDERAAWRKWHTTGISDGFCVVCRATWPCEIIRLLDEVDRLEAERRTTAQANDDTFADLVAERKAWEAEAVRLREQNAKLVETVQNIVRGWNHYVDSDFVDIDTLKAAISTAFTSFWPDDETSDVPVYTKYSDPPLADQGGETND